MRLSITNIEDEEFISSYLVKVLMSRIKYLLSTKNLLMMNNYLKKEFNTTVDNCIDAIEFSMNKLGKTYTISINNNTFEDKSHMKVVTLLRLIDYGTLNVRGLDIINEAFQYVSNHIREIYYSYIVKGGK